MVDLDRVIARMLSGGVAAFASRAGRRLGERTPRAAGIATIAELAYTAFERHRRGRNVSLAGGPSVAFLPPAADPAPRRALGLALLRTMLAAARAGGRLDGAARRAAFEAAQGLDLGSDEKALLLEELGRPIGFDEIAAAPRTPEQAAELYAAALLAIDADTPAERAWLSQLAARLALPGELVAEIHECLAAAPIAGATRRGRRPPRIVRAAASH